MFNLKAGALRPAHNDARAETLSAANDLVRKALSQEGRWNDAGMTEGALPMNGLMNGSNRLLAMQPGQRPIAQMRERPLRLTLLSESHTRRIGTRPFRHFMSASASVGVDGIVLMPHCCNQTLEDFAIGAGMYAQLGAHSLAVIYPEKAIGANSQTCWNWSGENNAGFYADPSGPDAGAAIIRFFVDPHVETAQ